MYWHRNPDVDLRQLERVYQNSGSIYDAARLMIVYLREGILDSAEAFLQIVERQYTEEGIKDLGLEATIITTHFGLGKKSVELCGGGVGRFGTVVCQYDKTIIWDIKRGYPAGTTQSWINEINKYLVQFGWVDSMPVLFKDILHPKPKETFENQKEPMYAVALFHETDDACIRIFWRNVYLPKIEEDYKQFRWWDAGFEHHAVMARIDLLLEDEPATRDYIGPKLFTGHIDVCRSENRHSFSGSSTLRVPLQVGVRKALQTVEQLANKIYFGKDWEEARKASGTDLYWPD